MEKKAKGGRPPKTNKRSRQFCIKLTEDEYCQLLLRAADCDLSKYVRHCLFGAALPTRIPEINREIWLRLSETTDYLHPLMRQANTVGSLLPPVCHEHMFRLSSDLAEIRCLLIGGTYGHR